MANVAEVQAMTLEQFVEAVEAHAGTAARFFEAEPTECADLDITLVAALVDHKFPNLEQPIVVLSQGDFTMLLTGGIQIGYTLARRIDAGTLEVVEAPAAEATDGEASGEAAAQE